MRNATPVTARMPSGLNADAGLSPLTAPSHGLSQRKLTCREVVYLVMAVELPFALDQTMTGGSCRFCVRRC